MNQRLMWAAVRAAFVVGLLFLVHPALAHSDGMQKYDAYCCNGSTVTGDCQKIDASTVTPAGDGYMVSIGPGDHRLATKPHVFIVPMRDVRTSQDGEYHACLFPTEDTLRCFYGPPMGF